MKKKNLIMTAIVIFGIAISTMAQVPSYVPTTGLVGWWPFNGNANDESGSGNNGTVNGATLTTDRFNVSNKAYYFNGQNKYIDIGTAGLSSNPNVCSYSVWFKTISLYTGLYGQTSAIMSKRHQDNGPSWMTIQLEPNCNVNFVVDGPAFNQGITGGSSVCNNQWQHLVCIKNENIYSVYLNSVLVASQTVNYNHVGSTMNMHVGHQGAWDTWFLGSIDDIGIWNSVLTQQEITNLYTATNCANNITISPQTNSLTTGSTATFTAATSDPNPSYIWQSNFGQGFQTLNNFGNYSGANTASLNIANVQLSEHNQPIRVISTSGNCIDTSNVAVINITDTCIVTVNDTITTLISVTDTLIINATVTGLTPPNNLNTIKVFPNPANDHITINYGNFASMSGYTLKITNNLGQVVFTSPINQQSSYIDLSTWTGNGIYFVQIIDTQNNTIENRKIVLQ